ncbi:Adenylosuccinate lyase [archaeon GW2011_AR15]|nr:Adenylosuccinate lyase [archaeon GW2011_AR15]MBS3104176.1 adenylosuccinate lyase [Candidatus Woesearchaeota archaeon]
MKNNLTAISPVDGRYQKKLKELSEYFSEYALIKKRVFVELKYLRELGKGDYLDIHKKFSLNEAQKVKEIEKKTNHDIKAVEYYIKERVPEKVREFVHYGLASEDVNNLAYSLLVKEFLEKEYYGKAESLLKKLKELSMKSRDVAMLGRTHGQPASPTTLGKEFFVFYSRLEKQYEKLKQVKLAGKLNGATGNYNALAFSEPERDWVSFSEKFIPGLGLEPNLITTQVEPRDALVELFQNVKRINNILLDMNRDLWAYISYGYFTLEKKDSETGSSTMPHKINPIDFENSEGNIKVANALLTAFEELQISRMQRDLSDSTVMRNIGVAFSHSILAYISALKGLEKLRPDKAAIKADLEKHPEILAEAVQTVLRKHGKKDAYEKLKELSRGKNISMEKLRDFIKKLDIEKKDKDRLLKLEPEDYTGLADKLVK